MRIVVTDTGIIWNHKNPYLEPFKDIVLVVCLNGEKVTDKYRCFVSPYRFEPIMGMDQYGGEDQMLKTLASVVGELDNEFGYHDDIIFLADYEPSTLYPYLVLKDWIRYNRLHLVALAPWSFENSLRKIAHIQMLEDLSALDSILYFNSDSALDETGWKSKLLNENRIDMARLKKAVLESYKYIRDYLGELMPCFLNGIYKMRKRPCFFDFASMSYVVMKSGFQNINLSKKDKVDKEIKFPVSRSFMTLGIVYPHSYPEDFDYVKEEVEKPVARLDGKKVCNVLREQRIRLAQANHIPFRSRECPSMGPCAGTCEKCDMELKYLRQQLQKIPEEQRVYPQFDPKEEMMLWL